MRPTHDPSLFRALTIAGSDSGGGAGVQADLKTFSRFGVFGTSALTLITSQNTHGVTGVELVSAAMVTAQVDAVLGDLGADAMKTGALGSAELVAVVAGLLRKHGAAKLVVDPVLRSKHGHALAGPEVVDALKSELLPLATLVTPNVHEASALVGFPIANEQELADAAVAIASLGPKYVLVKGAALGGPLAVDVLWDGAKSERLVAPRIETTRVHGTGCTYSAAITALLAKGRPVAEAVRQAKSFITSAIATAPRLGSGPAGPVNHWA